MLYTHHTSPHPVLICTPTVASLISHKIIIYFGMRSKGMLYGCDLIIPGVKMLTPCEQRHMKD